MLNINTGLKNLLPLFALCYLLNGCNIINPAEITPTYIHIDSFKFENNPLVNTTTLSAHITNAWVFYNNRAMGAFDLPLTIPIPANGSGRLEVYPAIIINGRNELVGRYEFYQVDTSTLTAQPGKIVNISPKTGYYSSVKIPYTEAFETPGITNFTRIDGNTIMVNVGADSLKYQGNGAGSIVLSAVGDSCTVISDKTFEIPQNVAFIELNYKSSIPFFLGIQANLSNLVSSSPYFLAGIKPTDHWQKFYLNVSDFAIRSKGTSYNFVIKTVLGSNQTSGRLLLDNIQLVNY